MLLCRVHTWCIDVSYMTIECKTWWNKMGRLLNKSISLSLIPLKHKHSLPRGRRWLEKSGIDSSDFSTWVYVLFWAPLWTSPTWGENDVIKNTNSIFEYREMFIICTSFLPFPLNTAETSLCVQRKSIKEIKYKSSYIYKYLIPTESSNLCHRIKKVSIIQTKAIVHEETQPARHTSSPKKKVGRIWGPDLGKFNCNHYQRWNVVTSSLVHETINL